MQDLYDLRRANLQTLVDQRFGGSQTRFAARVSLKYPSFVSRLLSVHPTARKNIGERMARSFEEALELPSGWFDRTHPASANEDDSGVRFMQKSKDGFSDLVPESVEYPRIPVYGARALALLDHIDEAPEVLRASETLPPSSPTQGARFAFRLEDDSMSDRFPSGTLAIIGKATEARDGDLVAVVFPAADKAVLRQCAQVAGRNFLIPQNAAYPAVEATPEVRVLGTAIEVRLQLK